MTMPVLMKHGQGAFTEAKETVFAGLFWMQLKVATSKNCRRYAYHHFDLNAGSGYNDLVDCDGSPLVFLDVADETGIEKYYAHFVDSDAHAVTQLLGRIGDRPKCLIYHGDNREFIRAIPRLITHFGGNPQYALGDVLCDPNGKEIHWQELSNLGLRCPRLDFIINYSARVWKRDRGAGYSPQIFLPEQLATLNREHWLIQEPAHGDRWEWMILVGRNFPMDKWAKQRLYHLDSDKGKEIMMRTFSRYELNYALPYEL